MQPPKGVVWRLREAARATRRLLRERETRRAFSRGLGSDVALNTVAGTGIFYIGDLCAQRVEKQPLNRRRAAVVAFAGGFFNGFPLSLSYRWLDFAFGSTQVARLAGACRGRLWATFWPAVPLKVLLAQLIYMPISTAAFLLILPPLHYLFDSRVPQAELGNKSPADFAAARACGRQKVRNCFTEVFLLSWLVWPLSDAFNFCFVPLRYRPVWDSFIDVFWTTYLSIVSHRHRAVHA